MKPKILIIIIYKKLTYFKIIKYILLLDFIFFSIILFKKKLI